MRELLQETAEVLRRGQADEQADLAERITTALAEPEPDAVEIVRKIREGATFGHDLSERYCKLLDSEAAALIESYGRRVPRAMLKELAIEILNLADLTWKISWQEYVKNLLTAIFTKHGVKVEDAE